MNEETPEPHDGNLVGMVGIVCICFCAFAAPVDCQKLETERTKHPPLFLSSDSHRSLLFGIICDCKMVALYVVRRLIAWGDGRLVRHCRSDWGSKYYNDNVENHCCPTAINAGNSFCPGEHILLCLTPLIWSLAKKFTFLQQERQSVMSNIFLNLCSVELTNCI